MISAPEPPPTPPASSPTGLGSRPLAQAVEATLSEAEAQGVPVDDLREQFSGHPASYDQLLGVYHRLNRVGFWVLEEGHTVQLGRGDIPMMVFLAPIQGAPANTVIMLGQTLG